MTKLGDDGHQGPSRRAILKGLAVVGAGSLTFRRALASQAAQAGAVTKDMIKQAEWIAGLELTEDERTRTARSVQQSLASFAELRKVDVGYDVAPALTFFPVARPAGGGRQAESGDSCRDAGRSPARICGGACVPHGRRALGIDPKPPGELDRAHEAVSRSAQTIRSAPQVRCDVHGRHCPQAGRAG